MSSGLNWCNLNHCMSSVISAQQGCWINLSVILLYLHGCDFYTHYLILAISDFITVWLKIRYKTPMSPKFILFEKIQVTQIKNLMCFTNSKKKIICTVILLFIIIKIIKGFYWSSLKPKLLFYPFLMLYLSWLHSHIHAWSSAPAWAQHMLRWGEIKLM